MKPAEALASITETYNYLRYVLREPRKSEHDSMLAYFDEAMAVFEIAARKQSCRVEWKKPTIYIKGNHKPNDVHRYPNIRDQSESTLEFTLWNARDQYRKAMLFVENSRLGHTLHCRLLSQPRGFEHGGRMSLDYVMDHQWPAHEAVLMEAARFIMGKEARARKAA